MTLHCARLSATGLLGAAGSSLHPVTAPMDVAAFLATLRHGFTNLFLYFSMY
jgi:hypothetical protein